MALSGKILKTLSLFLVFLVALASAPVPALAAPQLQWVDLVTGVNEGGNVVTTRVFGYYADVKGFGQVFVICDPKTGKETGWAYVPGTKVGEKKGQKLVRYERRRVEDWTVVKRIDPVQVRVIAPNVFDRVAYTDYSWEQEKLTGELKRVAYGPVSWPGSTKSYLLPDSDPDYWLIVVQVTNPNPWPVKVEVSGDIEKFREGFGHWEDTEILRFDKELSLGPNETKFILVNRGKPFSNAFLADDTEWSDGSPDRQQSWSEGYYRSDIVENMDPELPDYLKLNKGFIAFQNYAWGPPVPKDLSGGFTVSYRVECRLNTSWRSAWWFDGSVTLTEDGWVAHPKKNSKTSDAAKSAVEAFFAEHWPKVPYVDKDNRSVVIDDIRFYRCEIAGMSAHIDSGPTSVWYDLPGPAITDPDAERLELNSGYERISNVDNPSYVGWTNSIPVLRYKPVFIEMYRFVPTDTPDVGALVKEVSPGYHIYASYLRRPYVREESQGITYSISLNKYGSGRHKYWLYDVYIMHHVRLIAVNPDDAAVSFSSSGFALANLKLAVKYIGSYLSDYMDADVDIVSPDYQSRYYDPVFYRLTDFSLGPGESRVLYDGDVVTRIAIEDEVYVRNKYTGEVRKYYIPRQAVERAVSEAFSRYFSWSGEACFCGYPKFTVERAGSDIASLNQAIARYKRKKKKYDFFTFGAVARTRYLEPLSYFNPYFSPTNGVCARPADEVWQAIWNKPSLSITGRESRYWGKTAFGDFWPVMYLDSFKHHWYWTTTLYWDD